MSAPGESASSFGAFDTDAGALTRRIQAHARYGTRDLDPWVFDLLELSEGQRVLDLGCGTGKQTLPAAEAVGSEGRVVAVDASPEALATVRAAAEERGVIERISTIEARFDDLSAVGGEFDRVVSCFALYYVREPGPLFALIDRTLADRGLFFFCGPSAQNNAELRAVCESLRPDPQGPGSPSDPVVEFMERTGYELARGLFDDVDLLEFENPLRFDSAEALLAYWSSYNMYDPDLEEEFRSAVGRHFAREPVFETVKRVRAVRARKRASDSR